MATKILFFDEEKKIAEVLRDNLKLFDYDVKLVSTITDFMTEIYKTTVTYNLLLMDIMAPLPSEEEKEQWFTKEEIDHMANGLNTGVVLIDKIRSLSQEAYINFGKNVGEELPLKDRGIAKYANIPVLFYSAKRSAKDFPHAKLITKPALAKDILCEIETLLEKGGKQ